jgi:hypothetical protein
VEFAKTIHSSGNDLLMLINDILDLSKIESGTVVVDVNELRLSDLQLYVERTFRHVAEAKNVDFLIHTGLQPAGVDGHGRQAPAADPEEPAVQRLQVHPPGPRDADIEEAFTGWSPDNEDLNRAQQVLAFSVSDTGIGISPTSSRSSSRPSSRPTAPPAASTAAPAWAWPSAASCPSCWAARSAWPARRGRAAPSRCTCRWSTCPRAHAPHRAPQCRRETLDRCPSRRLPLPKLAAPADEPAAEDDGRVRAADNEANDDRDNIQPGDQVLLIVENDLAFARFLLDAARAKGFKGLVTSWAPAR